MTPSVLTVAANVPSVELDRMTDDGGPPPRSPTAPIRGVRAGDLRGLAGRTLGAGTFRDDWYRQLGVSHRRRNEATGLESCAREDLGREREAAMRRRWPGLVAAMRRLASRYNEGAGLEALTVADDAVGKSPDLIATIVARGGQTLTVTLSGAELCVRSSPFIAGSPDDGRRWIGSAASDEATAAYALQHWLTQL